MNARIGLGVVVVLVALAGIVKCALMARRETTNAKGVLALAVFLLAWVVSTVVAVFLNRVESVRTLWGSMALAIYSLALLAIFLGAVAIVEIIRKRGQYKQGLNQAILAIALSCLMIGIVTAGGYRNLRKMGEVPEELKLTASATAPATQPASLAFKDLNFEFKIPESWIQIDAKKINAESCLALARVKPQVYFYIVAEHPGPSVVDLSTDALVEVARTDLMSLSRHVDMDRAGRTVDGMPGVRLYSRANVGERDLTFAHLGLLAPGLPVSARCGGRAQG